jgi:hypothetical protein
VLADQPDRVYFQQQRSGASPLARLRIEHVSLAGRQLERLHPVRVLVQQEAQVGGGWRGRGDGQQHTAQSSASGRVRLAVLPVEPLQLVG